MLWVAIALGGALGALGRYAITSYIYPVMGNDFPLGTLIVNMLGSVFIGICYVLIIEKGLWAPQWRHLLMTGFLGAFTTFSTFSLDVVNLWQNGHLFSALSYVLISITSCIIAVLVSVSLTLKAIS